MASYKSGFDPPTRPGDTTQSRRQGTYTQPGYIRQENRELDIAHLSGQAGPRRGTTPVSRTPQTGLPRPSIQAPSPSSRMGLEPKRKGVSTSAFGFGRSASKTPAVPKIPELRGKSSRNVLRRKPSSIGVSKIIAKSTERSSSPTDSRQVATEGGEATEAMLKSAEAYNEIFTRRGARTPIVTGNPPIIPELDRYRSRSEKSSSFNNRILAELPHKLSTKDLPPPTPLLSGTPIYSGSSSSHHRYSGYSGSGYSASPSTRFSESPGPSPYSRDTTPCSMSSQSPGIIAPLKVVTPRLRQGNTPALIRPPVTRRRAGSTPNETEEPALDPHGLPSLRESLTSSSSNSTVKGEGKVKEKKKKKRLSPLPPSPPPRKSSQKFKKSRSEDQHSPSKPSQTPAQPVMTSPSEASSAKSSGFSHTRNKSNPPTRPSREGAPDLQNQLTESVRIIQSNLAGLNFSPERRRSGIPRGASSPLQSQLSPRSQQGSRLPSRNPSPSLIQASPREATPAPAGLGIIPDLRPQQISTSAKLQPSRTPSPSVSKPRFGLFGRRTKTAPAEVLTVESKDRGLRKGPAAGTGHEGYGRYGRRSSSTSGISRGRSISVASTSQESVSSTRTHDPFLLERMSPVIIAGGGEVIENRNASSELTRTESNTSLLLGRPSIESKDSFKSTLGPGQPRNTLWPSALPKDSGKRSSILVAPKGRRPSDSSDDGFGRSSLAFRRSVQRLNSSTSELHLPKPISIPGSGASPSMSSLDQSIMSDESQLDGNFELGRGHNHQMTKPRKLEKRPKSPRKWNIFHRSNANSKVKAEAPVQVTVGRPPVKAIPHYALLDSSDEQPDMEMDLEDLLLDAEVISLSNDELDALQFGESENLRRIGELRTRISPEPPKEQASAPLLFTSPEPMQIVPEASPTELHLTKESAPIRPSRLQQVGRIPKVISARPETTSPKSFSRPFARLSTIQPLLEPLVIDKESVALGRSPPKASTPEPEPATTQIDDETNVRMSSIDSKSDTGKDLDFLAFSPRKGSEATSTSSGGLSFAATTAIIPDPDAALEEDEVWDEYDDLIEHGEKVPVSATSSHGVPFPYEKYESRRARKSKIKAKESPTLASYPRVQERPRELSPPRKSFATSSSVYSTDMNAKLKEALAAIPTPTTPMSFTDFISGYGDRNNSVHGDSARKPLRSSQGSSRKSTSSSSHSRSLSGLRTIAEQESNSPISQVNLRVGSMTVSKWLTFGHVLFSPARDEIMGLEGQSKRHSILVIDGLGNDDWSFYAAETYPNSTFYNLSPSRPLSSQKNSTVPAFPLTPPNHRQVQYLSPLHRFPFPSSNFNVVVLRFPPIMSEASYKNLIGESKRVLKPSGYLEMAILDFDMMNMGNRARRAVRGLKMRIQDSDPDLSLASASDTFLRIVGKRGFRDIKSCNVGVPVASTIPSSSNSKNDKGKGKASEEMSLADMMKDESQAGDECITKMVAKVGRWWYTRCYETAAMPDSGSSMFDDESLLHECEMGNTSFKLVVAYAQKPVVVRRRTLSV